MGDGFGFGFGDGSGVVATFIAQSRELPAPLLLLLNSCVELMERVATLGRAQVQCWATQLSANAVKHAMQLSAGPARAAGAGGGGTV